MSTSPLSPKVIRGALVSLSLTDPALVVFQYNPESISRKLTPRRGKVETGADQSGKCGSGGEAQGFSGPPIETMSFTLMLDATDGLEEGAAIETSTGIATELAALEMLISPSKVAFFAQLLQAKVGVLDAIPPAPTITLLFLGPLRILPVRIDSISITEEAFDTILNPIRAKVDLSLSVLGPDDLPSDNPAYLFALNYSTVVKSAMALVATGAATAAAGQSILNAVKSI